MELNPFSSKCLQCYNVIQCYNVMFPLKYIVIFYKSTDSWVFDIPHVWVPARNHQADDWISCNSFRGINAQLACNTNAIQQSCNDSVAAGAAAMRQRHLMAYYKPYVAYYVPGCTLTNGNISGFYFKLFNFHNREYWLTKRISYKTLWVAPLSIVLWI